MGRMGSISLLSIFLVVVLLWSPQSLSEVVRFHDHKVIRATLSNAVQVEYVEKNELDVWSRDGFVVLGDNDIMVTPNHIEELKKLGVSFDVLIDDVEQNLRAADTPAVPRQEKSSFFTAYHTFAEIITFITNITSAYPHLATLVPSIGSSIENRVIPAIEITGGKNPTKSIFISGGQHAREWIAPATVLYILESLLTGYGVDPATTKLIDSFSIYIVPLVNPDGYVYTQTNRLWRKNRRLNSGGSYGVDLNRNWDEHWCQYGASRTQSSDTYCGTAPFSEPETQATSNYVLKHSHSALIDVHSYGQLVLRPYGWTTAPPPTLAILKSVGDGIAATIKAYSGKIYTSESGADLYPASGAADDWSYTVAKIPLVYTWELRDTGTYGFTLPANQIIPTGDEIYAAFIYLSTRA